MLARLGPDHVLDGEARVDQVAVAGDVHVLQVVQQARTLVPGHVLRAVHDVVPCQGRHRDHLEVGYLELGGERRELGPDLLEHVLVVVDEVHLVDAQHQVRHLQQRREERVPAALLDQALAGVDEDERQVGGRGAGDHVPRVLDVPGGVGDDELAPRRGEVPVGHVDRDALLALGAQAVGEQGQVHVLVAAVEAGALDRLDLVGEDGLGVV